MPEAKGRKEGPTTRSRSKAKPETPPAKLANVYHEEGNASVSEVFGAAPLPESVAIEMPVAPPEPVAE